MSNKIYDVEKNPEIDNLEKDSVQKKLYDELYAQFFEAQIPKSPDFPYGIEKGDQTDIRLMNSAYGFAKTIGDSIIVGGGGEEIDVTNLVKKSGDTMMGKLRAIRGLEAGENGRVTLSTNIDDSGVDFIKVLTYLALPDNGLKIGGANIIYRDTSALTTTIKDKVVKIDSDKLDLPSETTIGNYKFLKEGGIEGNGVKFYHTKNANLDSIDWNGKDITASENLYGKFLTVSDKSIFKGDIDVVIGGSSKFNVNKDSVSINLPLYLKNNLYVNNKSVIRGTEQGIVFEADETSVILGSEKTKDIKLSSPLKTWNGDSTIITQAGYGNFGMGFQASHDKSTPVIQTYSEKSGEKGIKIDNTIRFFEDKYVYLSSNKEHSGLSIGVKNGHMAIYGELSNSYYKPLNKESFSSVLDTNNDFIVSKKPIESENFTISGKETRLSDRLLKFSRGLMIEGAGNYIAHHGNMVIKNDMTTDNFSTGFAGSGWGIRNNPVTGITGITIDEATIRRKMRVYELEIQKISATNGALWVSDSLSGDSVTQII